MGLPKNSKDGTEWDAGAFESALDTLSISDLEMRRELFDQVIHEAVEKGDPRYRDLQVQQRLVNKVLVRKIKEQRGSNGKTEPKPQAIGMRAAALGVRRLGAGR